MNYWQQLAEDLRRAREALEQLRLSEEKRDQEKRAPHTIADFHKPPRTIQ